MDDLTHDRATPPPLHPDPGAPSGAAPGAGDADAAPGPEPDPRIRWALMPLRALRPGPAAEALDVLHVLGLAEAIAADGLRDALVIDRDGVVLSGDHRLAAMLLLSITGADQRVRAFLDGLGLDPDAWPEGPLATLAGRVHRLRAHGFYDRHWDGLIPVLIIHDRPGDDRAALVAAAEASDRAARQGRIDRAFIAGGFAARPARA